MHAIILAAGVGNRISAAHAGPKCLLEFGDRSLLQRHLLNLESLGVSNLTLVLGHQPDAIVAAAQRFGSVRTIAHFNPLYRLGSIVSLWAARQALLSGDDIVLMDADVLYHSKILEQLVRAPRGNYFMLDEDFEPGDEPVKICIDGDQIVEFRKQLPDGLVYNWIGESVGFFRFTPDCARSLATLSAQYVADGRRELPHEELLREIALSSSHKIDIVKVTGLPWVEIDFPEDITRAKDQILPLLENSS